MFDSFTAAAKALTFPVAAAACDRLAVAAWNVSLELEDFACGLRAASWRVACGPAVDVPGGTVQVTP